MRLVGTRVTGAGSKSLPSLEGPGLTGGVSAALGKGRSGRAGANGCPVRSFAAERSQVRLREDGGSGTGEDSIASGRRRQGVAPRGPMRGEAVGGGSAEAKTPKPLREPGGAQAVGWQGASPCSRSVARQRATAASCASAYVAVRWGGKMRSRMQQIVCARRGAGLEQKPGSLQVVEAGQALEEPVVVLAFLLEVPRDKGVVPEGGSEHGEPLVFRRERPVPNPDGRRPITAAEVCDAAGLLTSGVPDARFALMESDPRVVPQGGGKGVVQRADALRGRDYVDVIKEREDGLAIEELALQVGKRRMLCQDKLPCDVLGRAGGGGGPSTRRLRSDAGRRASPTWKASGKDAAFQTRVLDGLKRMCAWFNRWCCSLPKKCETRAVSAAARALVAELDSTGQ